MDNGESDQEHEVLLPSKIGGKNTPKAFLFLQSLKRKLEDVTLQAAVLEKKVAAEVAGSCQEEETAAAFPTPSDPEPLLATVSPIPAAAPLKTPSCRQTQPYEEMASEEKSRPTSGLALPRRLYTDRAYFFGKQF